MREEESGQGLAVGRKGEGSAAGMKGGLEAGMNKK